MINEEFSEEAAGRLWDAIQDYDTRRIEPLHESDCPACDLAFELAGALAAELGGEVDSAEDWGILLVTNGVEGDSKLDQITRLAAWVLHRKLPKALKGVLND